MVTIDESRWPVGVIILDGPTTEADVAAYTAALGRWLARSAPFAIVMVLPSEEASARQDRAAYSRVHSRTMAWLKPNKPRLSQWCRGLALVLEDPAVRAARAEPMARQGQTMFGCRVGVTATIAEAVRWAEERLDVSEEGRRWQ